MTLSRCHRFGRWLALSLLVTTGGGSTFLLDSCDPTVSTTVLGGLNDLSNTLVDALFIAIQAQQETDTGTTTTTP